MTATWYMYVVISCYVIVLIYKSEVGDIECFDTKFNNIIGTQVRFNSWQRHPSAGISS